MPDLFPYPENITNVSKTVTYTNTVSEGSFALGIPITFFLIIFIIGIIKKGRYSVYFTSASFVFTLFSILLTLGKWLNPYFVLVGIFLTALGTIWIKLEKSE